MTTPPYIYDILNGEIFIKGDCSEIEFELNKLSATKEKSRTKISYDNTITDLAANKDFITKFMLLIDLGICLGRDYKLTYDPAYTAQYLKDNGVQINSYQTISFSGQGGFDIEEH